MFDLSSEYLDLIDDNHRLLMENGDLRGDLIIARGANARLREKLADRDATIAQLRTNVDHAPVPKRSAAGGRR